jgi:N4-gp56 family major capsid protein
MKKLVNAVIIPYIYLQILATQTTLLGDLSVENKTYYDMTLLDNAQPKLVHRQFGQKRPIPKGSGKTIEFRKYTKLAKALTPLTEGVTPAGNSLKVTNKTATIAQYGDYIVLSDILELTAIDNNIVQATKVLGYQAGETDDTVVRNVMQSGTNVEYAASSGTRATDRGQLTSAYKMTVADAMLIMATFRANDVKPMSDGNYACIIHPHVAYDMKRDSEWRDMFKYANPENLYNGEIGRIDGCVFVQSSEAMVNWGENFNGTYRTLTVNLSAGYSGAITSITFDGAGTIEEGALVGRYININGIVAKITANTATTITFASTNFGNVPDNTVIYPGEGGKEGVNTYACLFLGADAYGVTDLEGGGLEVFVKQKGSSGTADALNQRSSVGWKEALTALILDDTSICRYECGSSFSKALASDYAN